MFWSGSSNTSRCNGDSHWFAGDLRRFGGLDRQGDSDRIDAAEGDSRLAKFAGGIHRQIRAGYLMQNLAEEFGQFRPGPSREELNHMLNLPQ